MRFFWYNSNAVLYSEFFFTLNAMDEHFIPIRSFEEVFSLYQELDLPDTYNIFFFMNYEMLTRVNMEQMVELICPPS